MINFLLLCAGLMFLSLFITFLIDVVTWIVVDGQMPRDREEQPALRRRFVIEFAGTSIAMIAVWFFLSPALLAPLSTWHTVVLAMSVIVAIPASAFICSNVRFDSADFAELVCSRPVYLHHFAKRMVREKKRKEAILSFKAAALALHDGGNRSGLATCLHAFGAYLLELGYTTDAVRCLRKAYEIRKRSISCSKSRLKSTETALVEARKAHKKHPAGLTTGYVREGFMCYLLADNRWARHWLNCAEELQLPPFLHPNLKIART